MIQYTNDNICALEKYNRYTLTSEIIDVLEHYTKMVSAPTYSKSPHFLIKKSIVLDNNRNKVVTIQDSIKKVLNKITDKNYEKLVKELVSHIKILKDELSNSESVGASVGASACASAGADENDNRVIDSTIELIFNNFFVSNMNMELNIDMCYRLIEEYSFIEKYLEKFIEEVEFLYRQVEVCKTISFEEMDRVSKINNIIKNKIIFLCRMEKQGKISKKLLDKYIIGYQLHLNNMLMEEQSKMDCDEAAELVLTFLNEKTKLDIEDSDDKDILENIMKIVNSNIQEMKSLSNKIVLKHKNILSKLNISNISSK